MQRETEQDKSRDSACAPSHESKKPTPAWLHRSWRIKGDLDLVDPRHARLTPIDGMEGGRHRAPQKSMVVINGPARIHIKYGRV